MFKKIMIALLVASSVATLAACNKEDEKPADDAATTAADAGAADAATDAPETEAPATTKKETEPTTPKETEPPKEYNYETVWKLDFSTWEDGAEAPFSKSGGVDDLYIEGGILKGISNGSDPFIEYKPAEGEEFAIDTTKVNCIRITIFNHTEQYEGQMFYGLEDKGFNEPDSTRIYWEYEASMDDNQVQVYEFDPNEDMNGGTWTGTLKKWRIDPFNGNTAGEFDIYSVEFCTKTEK